MYFSGTQNLIDTISSSELFQALEKLDCFIPKVDNQMDLSFDKTNQNNFWPNNFQEEGKINFQTYMSMVNKKTKGQSKIKNTENKQNRPKKIAPSHIKLQKKTNQLKKTKIVHKRDVAHYTSVFQQVTEQPIRKKNRSHSPLQKTNEKQNSSILKVKENKTKQGQGIQLRTVQGPKISQNSKQIMMRKKKEGKQYIPIQYRTSQLLKQKKQKLQKIQEEARRQKQKEQKQCTFKPVINSYRKIKREAIDRVSTVQSARVGLQYLSNIVPVQQNTQSTIELVKQFNSVKTQVHQNSKTLKQRQPKNLLQQMQRKKQKPLNCKYNTLLDLL